MRRKNEKSKKTNGIEEIDENRLLYPHLHIAMNRKCRNRRKPSKLMKFIEIIKIHLNSSKPIILYTSKYSNGPEKREIEENKRNSKN